MKDVNLETIIDMQSWCKTWPPNGSSRIRAKSKLHKKPRESLQKFLEPTIGKLKVICTDNSQECGKSCEGLSWNQFTPTPNRSETDGIAERAVRRIKEGTSAVLLQSGLDEKWWADSMECYCYLRNIQDLLSDGKTLHERRFAVPSNGPVIPFGAMAEYHIISAKDLSRLHQFGPKVLSGIFFGYALHAERIWKGDIEELEQVDASEINARRLDAKEVSTPMSGEKCMFPIADGTVKLSGRDQVLRTSTLIHLNPGSHRPRRRTRKSSRRENQTDLLQPHFETHRGVMVMLGMISGPSQAILFTVIT